RASTQRSCDAPTPATPRHTSRPVPRLHPPPVPATGRAAHRRAAWPADIDTCVAGYRPGPRTSRPASLPRPGWPRGLGRDLANVFGALLPDPQLHRRLGQRELELLVLNPHPPRRHRLATCQPRQPLLQHRLPATINEQTPPPRDRRLRHPIPARSHRLAHLTG